jgi:hypothetical protein
MRTVIIEETPNYSLREDGVITNITNGNILQGYYNLGYKMYRLRKDGKTIGRSLHRLLAIAFIPNPENKAFINHIDGNRGNYSLSNLEWVTPSENVQHAWDTGLNTFSESHMNALMRQCIKNKKKVLHTETGVVYDSVKDAAIANDILPSQLSRRMRYSKRLRNQFVYV